MILVADESVDRHVVAALDRIMDVYDVAAMNRGVSDDVVLSIARAQDAVLLTADKDFGELVFRDHMSELSEAFVVISARGVRIRRRM